MPCGILEEDPAHLHVTFGSSAKLSDFLADTLTAWGQGLTVQEQHSVERVQLTMDNGPESSGVRTQCLHRLVHLVATLGKPIQLRYYPPYHSKYNPIERCWGMLELHWHGTQLRDAETMLEWTKRRTWTGLTPGVDLSRKVYAKGGTLSKTARQAVAACVERNPLFPTWAILIHPARTTCSGIFILRNRLRPFSKPNAMPILPLITCAVR
jgi:hypothetical protein